MRLGPAAVVLFGFPAIVGAQVVHGTVVDRGGLPVPGVVVLLIDSASTTAARALTNEGGTFRLAGPHPGTYRLRTLRIGFRPILSDPLTLAAGQDLTERVELAGLPIALDTMRVSSRSQCHTVGDSGGATFRVWEQVRSALMATSITAGARVLNASSIDYTRTLDPADRVTAQSSTIRSEYVTQPWRALSEDSLHRAGYVTTDVNGWTTYYAPGMETLLSEGFVGDHCFRLVSNRTQLGIAFEPGSDRGDIPEVRGTLWLDRGTAELRSLEFQYVNIPKDQAERARGRVTYARTSNGIWLLSGWRIEMPVVSRQVHEPSIIHGVSTLGYVETVVSEVRVHGGELISARRGNDTVWTGPRWRLTGTVADSLSDSPIAGARVQLLGADLSTVTDAQGRFTMDRVLPGDYTLEVRTASLDAVGAVNRRTLSFSDSGAVHVRVPSGQQAIALACKTQVDLPGIVGGLVSILGDSGGAANVEVEARWTQPHLRMAPGYAVVTYTENSVRTRADGSGHFTLCGVPRDEAISVFVVGDTTAGTKVVYVPREGRFVWANLMVTRFVRPQQITNGFRSLTGVVVAENKSTPLVGADVLLPEINRATRTNEQGAFTLDDVPLGSAHLVVRRLGFAPIDTTVTISTQSRFQFVLSTLQTLDSVVTNARNVIPSFEENRRAGLGHFFTRADLAKVEELHLSAILAATPGTKFMHGNQGTWMIGGHGETSMGGSSALFFPNREDQFRGARPACYSMVYLDGALIFGARPTGGSKPPNSPDAAEPLFNLNSLLGSQLEAVEFYDGASQTPLRYSTLNSQCGVLVIWSRRRTEQHE